MAKRRVCLYVTGWPSGPVRQRFGTYVDWFAHLFAEHDVAVEVCDATCDETPDSGRAHAALVITGSPASLTCREPWMDAAIALIRQAHRQRTPVLGVCFGHQLIGEAFGSSVVRNPAGWQLCTGAVSVLERGQRDPLFADLPATFAVNFSHQDIVAPLGGALGVEGATTPGGRSDIELLAKNRKAPVTAIAVGRHIRGIQFHPEFSGAITRSYIEQRRAVLAREAEANQCPEDHPDQLLQSVSDTPSGVQVFHNFLRHFANRPDSGPGEA